MTDCCPTKGKWLKQLAVENGKRWKLVANPLGHIIRPAADCQSITIYGRSGQLLAPLVGALRSNLSVRYSVPRETMLP
ncbi:hypothetical protein EOB36_11795 [Mesorhizobium sp. M6A.T.Cr.TU.017.01.1.1]|nr:hypothetical protein EOB36_11795 [Mesorhizobium sp. M6A.T.Cr.TU.017.01.1.1]